MSQFYFFYVPANNVHHNTNCNAKQKLSETKQVFYGLKLRFIIKTHVYFDSKKEKSKTKVAPHYSLGKNTH